MRTNTKDVDTFYLRGESGHLFKESATVSNYDKNLVEVTNSRKKVRRTQRQLGTVFGVQARFTMRKNINFGIVDPTHVLTVNLCPNMNPELFTEDYCNEMRNNVENLIKQLKRIEPNISFYGVLEGYPAFRKVLPTVFHYHILIKGINDDQMEEIRSYCEERFYFSDRDRIIEPIQSVKKIKKYLCKMSKGGKPVKMKSIPSWWNGDFLKKTISSNLNTKENIKNAQRVKVDTSTYKLAYRVIFENIYNRMNNRKCPSFKTLKREYVLNTRNKRHFEKLLQKPLKPPLDIKGEMFRKETSGGIYGRIKEVLGGIWSLIAGASSS